MAMPGTETLRFRRPTHGPTAVGVQKEEPQFDQFGAPALKGWKRRHQGLLQDQTRRQAAAPLVPSLSVAFRTLLLVRAFGAMYSVIADCDEVFNFYEPLHYFQHNGGFQTWELSPEFAVRSWAYILLHWPLAHLGPLLLGLGKRQQFFALRLTLGAISSYCEARFFRSVVEAVNERVGRYLFFSMLFSAGMWSASVAFLPSSFTMYTTMIAASFWMHPATSTPTGVWRCRAGVFFVAVGAIIGWPFAAAIGIPFVLEQLFVAGGEIVLPADSARWAKRRLWLLFQAIMYSALLAIPVFYFDSWAYGRRVFPTLNIVKYNLFSGFGPDLYGTEPATYYLANLFLNFNFLVPLALISLPALAVTYMFDFRRLGATQMKPREGESSPYLLLTLRLAPFYIWLGILTAQAHKEERFMFPIYPLLCFNAAVSVYLIRGWFETAFIKATKSPYRASQTSAFSYITLAAILIPAILSLGRIGAMQQFYHAPLDVVNYFQYTTLPNILADLGFEPLPMHPNKKDPRDIEKHEPEWDLSPLKDIDPPVSLCYGAEWHRFPGSYLIPEGVEVQWIRSEFDGMMPRRWDKSESKSWWPRPETRVYHPGRFNGANKPSQEEGTYVSIDECSYLVTLRLPSATPTELEPDYVHDPTWEREFCTTFLDAPSSQWWSRLVWVPGGLFENGRVYGEYCLLRRK